VSRGECRGATVEGGSGVVPGGEEVFGLALTPALSPRRGRGGVLGGEEVLRQLDGEGFERGVGGSIQMGDELLLGSGGDARALAGFGFQAVGAAAGQFEELGAVAVVAETGEFREQFPQEMPAVLGAGGAFEEVAGGKGEVSGEDQGQFFGEGTAGGGVEVGGVFGELGEPVAFLVEVLPIEKAALFPMGEIHFVRGGEVVFAHN